MQKIFYHKNIRALFFTIALFWISLLKANEAVLSSRNFYSHSCYKVQLELQPKKDRIIVRLTNNSGKKQLLDFRSISYLNLYFNAQKYHHNLKPVILSGEQSAIEAEGVNGDFAVFSNSIVTTNLGGWKRFGFSKPQANSVLLPPKTYLGICIKSEEVTIFKALETVVLKVHSGYFWALNCSLTTQNATTGESLSHTDKKRIISNHVKVSEEMIKQFRSDNKIIGNISSSAPKIYDSRLQAILHFIPEMNALMADIVAISHANTKYQHEPVDQYRIHIKTLEKQSWRWLVKSDNKIIYASQKMQTKEKFEYGKANASPSLQKNQLIGRMFEFTETPMFQAMLKHFVAEKKITPCTIKLFLPLFLPNKNGFPKKTKILTTRPLTITAKQFQRARGVTPIF